MTTGKRSSIGGEERHVAQRAVQALRDVAVLTEGAFEPSRLAELVVQNTCSLLQCDSSGLYVCDEDDGLLHCLADNGPMRGTGLRSIAERRGVTWRAFTTGKPCVVNDYSSWEMSHPLALKSGVKSDVAVPLLIGSRVIGTLNARSYVPRMWQPYEVDLLALFAAQVSPTLQLVQLYATAERKRSESEALAKLVRAGATERSVERVLNLICEQAGHLLNGDYSGISLVGDDGTRGPEWSGRWGQRLPRWPNYGRGVGRGVITPSIRERRTIVRDDLDTALTAPSIHLGEGGKSAVATPLISRGRVRGVLFVAWRTRVRPGPGQLRLVEALAGYAATIVDNVESYVRERDARATAEALVKERQRVAMDLHDGIIQSLYGVVLLLGAARREPEVTDETRTALDQAIEHISEVIEEGRGYIHDLRSLTEQRQEICSSVRQLARSMLAGGAVHLELKLPDQLDVELQPETTDEVLYIVREALSNALRHAQPAHIGIHLQTEAGSLRVRIDDDGEGFDVTDALTPQGDGLKNMRYRASCLHGRLAIESRRGKGTTVKLDVPLTAAT